MTQRIKLVETEVATATSAGAATSITQATCVRLYNSTAGDVTVNLNPSVGSATTTSFTMPTKSVEYLEKLPTDVVYTSSAIKAAKVAFTN